MSKTSEDRTLAQAMQSWRGSYETAAGLDRYRWILAQFDHDETEGPTKGAELVAGLIDVVAYVLALQDMDGPLTITEVDRFLGLQRYGATPSTGFGVQIGPWPEVKLFVDELRFLDFEDLFDRFEFYDVCVSRPAGEFTEEEAQAMIEHVRNDLTYGGEEYDFDCWSDGRGVNVHAMPSE